MLAGATALLLIIGTGPISYIRESAFLLFVRHLTLLFKL
jgi:hypothetical protein